MQQNRIHLLSRTRSKTIPPIPQVLSHRCFNAFHENTVTGVNKFTVTMSEESKVFFELKRLGTLTSAKGVGRIIKSENQWLRVMWIVAVIFLFAVTIFNVWNLVHQYLQYSTDTKITEKTIDIVRDTGTDVVLCNVNPYSTASLNTTVGLKSAYLDTVSNWTRVSGQHSRESRVLLNTIRQELMKGHSGFFQDLGLQEASLLSHSWKDFVLSCHIFYLDGVMEKTTPCSFVRMGIALYQHQHFFNCFKIYGENRGKASTRPTTGMSFLLYIDDIKESENARDSNLHSAGRGAVLAIGDSGTFVNPDTDGIEILPGYVNVIRFKPVRRIRLPKPHGECMRRKSQHIPGPGGGVNESNAYGNPFNLPYLYTEDACLGACIENYIAQTCGCQDGGQYGTMLRVFGNVSFCGATDAGREIFLDRLQCTLKWRSVFRKQCLSQCPPPCTEKLMDKSATYLEMSRFELEAQLEEEKKRSSVPTIDPNIKNIVPSFVLDAEMSHFAQVNLKRRRTSYFVIEDTKAMTVSDLLAKIGGAMNLWSGITVFVFIEVLDFICRLGQGIVVTENATAPSRKQGNGHCTCDSAEKSRIDDFDERYTQEYSNIRVNTVYK